MYIWILIYELTRARWKIERQILYIDCANVSSSATLNATTFRCWTQTISNIGSAHRISPFRKEQFFASHCPYGPCILSD